MTAILTLVTSIGLVLGGLTAAALLCWLLWRTFLLVRHPDWAAAIIPILIALAASGKLPNSQFLHLALAYAIVGVVPLWIEGRRWRHDHSATPNKLLKETSR